MMIIITLIILMDFFLSQWWLSSPSGIILHHLNCESISKMFKVQAFYYYLLSSHFSSEEKKSIYWSNPLRLLTLKINIINYISFNPTSILFPICYFIFYFSRVVFLSSSAFFLQLFHLQMIFTVFFLILIFCCIKYSILNFNSNRLLYRFVH